MNESHAREIAALSHEDFIAGWRALPRPQRNHALRMRHRYRRDEFLLWAFPDRYDLEWSQVHLAFLADETTCWRDRKRQAKHLDIAPRGAAKTSLKSFGDVVHAVCFGLEVSVLVFSTGYQLAEDIVKDLHQVFTGKGDGESLAGVYGPFMVTGTQTSFSVATPHGEPLGTQIAAMSFGGTVRGHKYKGRRPSLFILDDTVNPKHLKNPTMREKSAKFLNSDILKAGFNYSRFQMVGTIQHEDDLVARAEKSPGWKTRKWKNLISWPKNTEAWEECRKIWARLENMNRVEDAYAFYLDNQAAMDDGAEVLWPEGRGLFALMCAFWENPSAFFAEDQNEPRDLRTMIFDLSRIRRCRWDGPVIHTSRGTDVQLADCRVALWLDPSGGGDGSDIPAIVAMAKDPHGYRYVIAAEGPHRPPSAQQAALWGWWERLGAWRPIVGADITGTQGLLGEAFERERVRRRAAGLAYNMQVNGKAFAISKPDRISGLEPDLNNGFIELDHALPGEYIAELGFPTATTDDFLDATEAADGLLGRGGDEWVSSPTLAGLYSR